MGKKIREGGQAEGLEVLHILASSPATARFISSELAVRFVSDTPPPALVDRMAKAFTKSHGEIRLVLRAMFDSPEFWTPQVYRAKVKTPEEFVFSAVRASGAEVTNAGQLVQTLDKLGMPLYGMQTPNGYSWTAEPWVNTGDLLNRMNFALALSADKVRGVRTSWPALLDRTESVGGAEESGKSSIGDVGERERGLEVALFGHPADERTRAAVMGQVATLAPGTPAGGVLQTSAPRMGKMPSGSREDAVIGGLLLGSPEFQRR